MHRTKIEWADYAWNPVTGCLNQQRCRYCYIDADAKRFSGDVRMNKAATGKYKKEGALYILDEKFTLETGNVLTMPFRSEPTFYRYRLKTLDQLKSGQNVLVSYGGEMFGPWVPDSVIEEVFAACLDHPKNHYLFCTSYPERYEDLRKKHMLPEGDQYWYGTSIGFGNQSVFANEYYHSFVVASPMPKNPGIDPRAEWCICGGWSPQTPKKYRETIDKERTNSFIQTCIDWKIPVFCESTLSPDETDFTELHEVPAVLQKKLMGDKKAELQVTSCISCGRRDRKKNMVAILARPGRGKASPCLGYIHRHEFKAFCENNHMTEDGVQKVLEGIGDESRRLQRSDGRHGSQPDGKRGKEADGKDEKLPDETGREERARESGQGQEDDGPADREDA